MTRLCMTPPLFAYHVVNPRGGEAITYISKVLGYSPIAYWPLNESAGAAAAICQIDTDQNGTPSNVTFGDTLGPDGVNYAPSFNGISSTISIDTAALEAAFDGDEGTISIWIKVSGSGVWTDGIYRTMLSLYGDSANNFRIQKTNANNNFRVLRLVTDESDIYSATQSTTDWFNFCMRWSVTGGKVEYFIDGSEIVGELSITNSYNSSTFSHATIGSFGSSYWWSGWLAHVAVFDSALSDEAILALATVSGSAKAQSLEGLLDFEAEEEKLWWEGADLVEAAAQAIEAPELTWWQKANNVVSDALGKAKKWMNDKLHQLWHAIEDYFDYHEEE